MALCEAKHYKLDNNRPSSFYGLYAFCKPRNWSLVRFIAEISLPDKSGKTHVYMTIYQCDKGTHNATCSSSTFVDKHIGWNVSSETCYTSELRNQVVITLGISVLCALLQLFHDRKVVWVFDTNDGSVQWYRGACYISQLHRTSQ